MPDNSASNKRITRNSIYMTIRMIVVLAITFYTTRVILDKLGVIDYGVYNVVCGFVTMFGFLNTSMSNGIQRFFNYELGKNGIQATNNVFNTALLIQFILGIIIILLTETIGLWYLHSKMVIPEGRLIAAEWIFQFSIISFLLVIMQAPFSAAVMAHEKMDFYAVVNVLDAILKLLIVLILPWFDYDRLIIYGGLFASISLINLALYYFYCRVNFKELRVTIHFDKSLFRSMLSFSGWNVFGSLSGVMKEQGINLVMNFFFGPVVNAARGVANQVNGGLQSFVRNITIPVRPQVIQSFAEGNFNRTINLTYSISKLSCYFIIMLSIPIVLNLDVILNIWLKNNIPDHAANFIIIVLGLSIISNLNAAISGVVHASGDMKKYQTISSIFEIAAVPIAYFTMKLYPVPEAALLIVLIAAATAHASCLFILSGIVPFSVSDYCRKVVIPLCILLGLSVCVCVPIHYMAAHSIVGVVTDCFVSAIISSSVMYLFVLNKKEKAIVLSVVKIVKHRFIK